MNDSIMEEFDSVSSVLRFLAWFVILLIYLYLQVRYSDTSFVKKSFKKYLILRNLDSVYRPYLTQYFSFYNSLNSKNKLVFERRVQKFIDLKQFIPRGVKEITPEMKATIAGSAIQLTFGYPDVYFKHFWRILVYSDSYYSTITHRYHMGEVSMQGLIVLSWKGFKEGFANPSDGRNLGFHEMAHALRLINIVDNEEYNFYDRDVMDEFDIEAQKETLKILNSPHDVTFFKNYFVPNSMEFFSVCVECFFEKPNGLKDYNPKLYLLLSQILKIDPLLFCNTGESQKQAS